MNSEILNAFLFIFFMIFIYLKVDKKPDIIKCKPSIKVRGYSVVYSDQKSGFDASKVVISEMLNSQKYSLRGKPDYILMDSQKKNMIVLELKSGTIKEQSKPHFGDMMQVAAYFLMIEDVFGIVPKEGRIIYKDFMFIVKNTSCLRETLLGILEEMSLMLETGHGKANNSFAKCRYCICNGTVCEHCKK